MASLLIEIPNGPLIYTIIYGQRAEIVQHSQNIISSFAAAAEECR